MMQLILYIKGWKKKVTYLTIIKTSNQYFVMMKHYQIIETTLRCIYSVFLKYMYQFLYIYVKSKAIKRENFMNLLDLDSMYNSNKIRFEIPRKLLIIIVWFWKSRLSQLCNLPMSQKKVIFWVWKMLESQKLHQMALNWHSISQKKNPLFTCFS